MNMVRLRNKINQAINRLNLDLSGTIVLTEAATGAYSVTPVIAAVAGAKVYAYTKDSRFGSVKEVKNQTFKLLSQFETSIDRITIIEELNPQIISSADVITNSGHLRPLNNKLLKYSKKGVVIPLMYEAWELRDSDIDLKLCREMGIKVGATNERHPAIDVFNYLGDMAIRLILDAGLCMYGNRFVLICNNDFGPYIAKSLTQNCISVAVCDLKEHRSKYANLPIDWIGDFLDFSIPKKYRNCEAIIFTAYPFEKTWIGDNAPIQIEKLKSEFENPYILRYAGHLDEEQCKDRIEFYPDLVQAGHMGILPSDIGNDPIIKLQAGGLKVAELLIKGETNYEEQPILQLV